MVAPNLGHNSLGRAYSLWLLAKRLGWSATIYASAGHAVWTPLEKTAFAQDCNGGTKAVLHELAAASDLVVSIKPFAASLGIAAEAAKATSTPLLADIDDPDIEAVLSWRNPFKRAAKTVLRRGTVNEATNMRQLVRGLSITTSNPCLQSRYGGTLLPHAREAMDAGQAQHSGPTTVAFVGTNRPHKGVAILRSAMSRLDHSEYHLIITDYPPRDEKPWETWSGPMGIEEAFRLVQSADVVTIPSRRTAYALGQFPVKLVDAMMSARAVVASDLPPLRWALGDTGILVRPGSVIALKRGIEKAARLGKATDIGARARERALAMFSVDTLAPVFERACRSAAETGSGLSLGEFL